MAVPSAFTASLTPAERAAYGRDARTRASRSCHGWFEAGKERPDPIEVIERQSATRLPELVPIRYGRMLDSPFRFYRGAAPIMAADLAARPDSGIDGAALRRRPPAATSGCSPRPSGSSSSTSTTSTRPCPARGSGTSSGWPPASSSPAGPTASRAKERAGVVRATRRGLPRSGCGRFAGMRNWTSGTPRSTSSGYGRRLATEQSADPAPQPPRRDGEGPHARQPPGLRESSPRCVDGHGRITADPPLIVPLEDLLPDAERGDVEKELARDDPGRVQADPAVRAPASCCDQYQLVDMARKVVGVGSVGTRCWIVLLLGRDDARPAAAAGQGGAGSRCSPPYAGAEPLRQPGPPGGGRPAADAGHQRHLPRLGPRRGPRRTPSATSTYASCGTGRARRGRDHGRRACCGLRRAVRRPRWRGPTPARATGSPSPPTWAAATPSTGRSPSSPRPTPTRTSATSRRSAPLSRPAGSGRKACDRRSWTAAREPLLVGSPYAAGSCRSSYAAERRVTPAAGASPGPAAPATGSGPAARTGVPRR